MEKLTLKNGIDLYINKSDKFKTWSAKVYFYRPLNVREASYNALLAKVLKSSAKRYPSRKLLAKRLDTLYGAGISTGARKFGDSHALVFSIKAVCDCYLPENISRQVSELLKMIITEPDVSEGSFVADTVELEKENLIKQIEAYVNDKSAYADKRCLEILCEGNVFATDVNGTIDEIRKITPESLYTHYVDVMSNSRADVFLCGNADVETVKETFESLNCKGSLPETKPVTPPPNVIEVSDVMDVTQGKLVMGFNTELTSNEYRCPIMVFNALFGGCATSKLFNNVREKLSLAYYANSRVVIGKGIMFARSGIEICKYVQVRDEIMAQLAEICNGNFTKDELENVKSHIVNIYTSLEDDPESTVSLVSGWITEGETRSVDEIIAGVKAVTAEEVVAVAKTYKLGCVYFLKGEG